MTLQDFGTPTNPIDEQVHWVVTINDEVGQMVKLRLQSIKTVKRLEQELQTMIYQDLRTTTSLLVDHNGRQHSQCIMG